MKSLVNFLDYISRLKLTVRTGWDLHDVPGIRETIGSHSFGVTFLAWILAKKEDVDVDKTIKLALIHDLLEGITGDITPYDDSYRIKQVIEKKAMSELKKLLPLELKKDVENLIEELNEGKTRESQIVMQADKLDTAFQAYLYEKKKFGKNIRDSDLSAFFDFHVKEKFSKEFLSYIKSLRKKT
ncbi:MAG: HD domain-containing protein [Candidatus Aenigmarchaeota archaeon]|nr:HD domain-containing protein [Candidatus Aenigmarchaeota archaeon]